jgi:hypothetical protein
MKLSKLTFPLLAALALGGLTTTAFAADKEITVTGTAQCAKCALHKSDKCETVLTATVDGKEVTYQLAGKDVQSFHDKICAGTSEKITVTGNVTGKDGKEVLHVTKLEEVK